MCAVRCLVGSDEPPAAGTAAQEGGGGMKCAWCRSPLADAAGKPRWELYWCVGQMVFVCLGGCRPVPTVVPNVGAVTLGRVRTVSAPVLAGEKVSAA